MLIAAGADLEPQAAATCLGVVPLHCACKHGHVECVRMLLQAGAATDIKRADGPSAVYIALWRGHVPCACALVAAGVDVDCRDHHILLMLRNAC